MPLTALVCLALLPQQSAPEPVRALFLGDRGHHRPSALHAVLEPALAARGIELAYTEDVGALSPEGLAPHDVLVVYANVDELAPDAEAALLAFVEGGHGLVALHCASYCFRNSDAWIALVGAQFASHGGEVFTPLVTDAEHAVTRGWIGFTSWDETYVHVRHASDRRVLAWRVDEHGREPWTWVREQGGGRVFYTASGHDERTWGESEFQELVARAVRWCGRALPEPPPLPPLAHVPADVPEYLPAGGQARRATMQAPLAPADSRAHLCARTGFDVELFAAEPDIGPALAIAWDERGRCFLAESVDYPNERRDAGGRDCIRIAEDTDGDGRADRFSVFAEDLSVPTSLVHERGGWIVAQAPHVLLVEDVDGDDRADRRSVLFTGFSTSDTHAGPSNFRRGFDGWIWGTVGYAGFDGEVGGERHRFGQGVFRFLADGSRLEFLGSTSNNTWGLGFDETGEVFVSTANHDQINHLGLASRVYESVAGWSGRPVRFIADYRAIHPLLEGVRQVDWHGRFTAAAGCAPYTARLFPERYWNRVAFVTEPTGRLVAEAVLERAGAGFVAHDGANLVASRDEWFAPVAAEVGPDGAVWVVDWYDYVVQHNPTPRGFTTGKGAAYETPLRDSKRARIWRVVPHDARIARFPDLAGGAGEPADGTRGAEAPADATSGAEPPLVAALGHDNLFWRMRAQERIARERRLDLVPALAERVRAAQLDAIGNDPGALHALCALAELGALDAADARGERAAPRASGDAASWSADDVLALLAAALRHPAPALRKHALRFLPRDARGVEALLAARSLDDADALVRREALVAASEMPPSAALGALLVERLASRRDLDDRWLADATLAAAARNAQHVLLAAPARLRSSPAAPSAPAPNLLPNPSFEEADSRDATQPAGWRTRTYSGRAEHAWIAEGRGGGRCLAIRSDAGSDTSWCADVAVTSGTRYRLSGWVRVDALDAESAMGALMNVHVSPEPTVTRALRGSGDWERVEVVFDSGERERVSINCLFGGWGRARGRALWDDVALVEARDEAFAGLSREVAAVLARTTRHYARHASAEDAGRLVTAMREGDADVAGAIVEGLLEGWPEERALALDAAAQRFVAELVAKLPLERAAAIVALAGRRGLALDEARTAIVAALADALGEDERPADERAQSARALVAIDDGAVARERVLSAITPRLAPDLAEELVEALGESARDEVAGALLARWSELAPSARAASLRVLRRRARWTHALLDAIEAGTVERGALSAQDWQQLAHSPDAEIARRAETLAASRGAAASERVAAALARLAPAAERAGDAARGRAHFAKTCALCHRLGGEGGTAGPALDGFGARPRAEILSEIVDPNRSVESTYQLWVVQTQGGEVLGGRVVNESRTSIELLTSDARSVVLDREDVEVLRATGVSLMPEGLLDELDEGAVADLLELLAASR